MQQQLLFLHALTNQEDCELISLDISYSCLLLFDHDVEQACVPQRLANLTREAGHCSRWWTQRVQATRSWQVHSVMLCLFFVFLHVPNKRLLLLEYVTYTWHISFCTYYSCLPFTWVIIWLIDWFVMTHFVLWLILTHTVAYDSLNRTTHIMTRIFVVTHIMV